MAALDLTRPAGLFFIQMLGLVSLLLREGLCVPNNVVTTLTPSLETINSVTSLTFALDCTTSRAYVYEYASSLASIPAGSIVVINFPSAYYSIATNAPMQVDTSLNSLLTIFATAPNQVTIRNAFPAVSSPTSLSFKILNLNNPSISNTEINGFSLSILDPSNNIVLQSTTDQFLTFKLKPAPLQALTATFASPVVDTSSNLLFSVTPTTTISASGTVTITLGSAWSNQAVATPYLTGTPYCSGANAGITCSLSQAGGSTIITVSGLFLTASNSAFSFTIVNFLSPPTVNNPNDPVVVSTFDSAGNQLDTGTLYINGLSPKNVLLLSFNQQATASVRSLNTLYQVNFTAGSFFRLTDTINIAFDRDLNIANVNVTLPALFTGVTMAKDTSGTNNLVTLSNFVRSSTTNLNTLLPFIFNIFNLTLGPSVHPAPIVVRFFRNSLLYQQFSCSIAARTASFQSTPALSLSNPRVNLLQTLTFRVVPANPLTSTGGFTIVLPSQLTVQTPLTCSASSSPSGLISVSPTCIPSGSTITVSNLFSTDFTPSASNTLTIVLNNIRNPGNIAPTGNFIITSYYNTTTLAAVDSFSGLAFTPTPGTLTTAVATPQVPTTFAATNYNFKLVFTDHVPSAGSIAVAFPLGVSVLNPAGSFQCSYTSASTTASLPCSYSALNNGTNSFMLTFTSLPAVAAGTQLLLDVLNNKIRNPLLVSTISSFTIASYDTGGIMIDYLGNSVSLTMTTPCSSCASVAIAPGSDVNSAVSTLTFTLGTAFSLPSGSTLEITFPAAIVPGGSSVCTTNVGTVTCAAVTGSPTIVSVTSASAIPLQVAFTLTNIQNAFSLAPSGSFSFLGKASTGQSIFATTSVPPANAKPSVYTVSASFTNKFLKQATSISVSLTGKALPLGGYILITVPSQFTLGTLSCSNAVNLGTISCTPLSGSQLKVTGTTYSTQVGFQISGLTNPSTAGSDYFIFASYITGDFMVDRDAGTVSFTLDCTLPCKTCASGNPGVCLSCYSDPTLVDSKVYLSGSLCQSTCPLGTFSTTSGGNPVCEACQQPCKGCSTTRSTCTSCDLAGSNPILDQSTCNPSCPARYFVFTDVNGVKTCSACINNCYTCSSSTNCLSCSAPLYLTPTSTCENGCPLGYFQGNLQTCVTCPTGCTSCTSLSVCQTCGAGYFMSGTICASSCPAPTVLYNGACANCDSTYKCLTCSGTIFTCTSCDPNTAFKYLASTTCVSSCTDTTFYASDTLGKCMPCTNNCLTCSSAVCLSCVAGYLQLGPKCEQNCPAGYLPQGSTCRPCTSNCATCQNLDSTCISCTGIYYLNGNACSTSCTAPKIAFSNQCIDCTSHCATCINQPNYCVTCVPGYLLSGSNCLSICVLPLVQNIDANSCVPCNQAYCLTCTGVQNICATCNSTTFLSGQTCVTNCLTGTFANSATRVCTPCNNLATNCATCNSAQCLTCAAGYFQLNGVCGTSCSVPFPVQGAGVCQPCPTNCQNCNSVGYCSQCVPSSGTSLSQGSCVSTCPTPTISVAYVCTACSGCATCSGLPTTCLSCPSGLYLQSGSCIPACTNGLVPSQSGLNCVTCSTPCRACSGRQDYCTSCLNGLFLQGNSCLTACSSGVGVNGVCVSCGVGCASCNSDLTCLICNTNFFLSEGGCFSSCPPSAPIVSGRNCMACSSPCASCNATTCLRCSTPYLLFNGQCVDKCPSPYNSDGINCSMNSSTSTIIGNNNQTGVLPVPCTITGTLLALGVVLSRFAYSDLRILTSLSSLLSLPQVISWWVLLGYQAGKSWTLALTATACSLMLVMNIASLALWSRYILPDRRFQTYERSKFNFGFSRAVLLLSTASTFKFKQILFSKLLDAPVLSARLESANLLFPSSLLTLVSLLLCSSLAVISGALYLRQISNSGTQQFMQAVDVMVLSLFVLLLNLLNLKKGDQYFKQSGQSFIVDQTEIHQIDQMPQEGEESLISHSGGKPIRDQALHLRSIREENEQQLLLQSQENIRNNKIGPEGFLTKERVLQSSDEEERRNFQQKQEEQLALSNSKFKAKLADQNILISNWPSKSYSPKPQTEINQADQKESRQKGTMSDTEGQDLKRVETGVRHISKGKDGKRDQLKVSDKASQGKKKSQREAQQQKGNRGQSPQKLSKKNDQEGQLNAHSVIRQTNSFIEEGSQNRSNKKADPAFYPAISQVRPAHSGQIDKGSKQDQIQKLVSQMGEKAEGRQPAGNQSPIAKAGSISPVQKVNQQSSRKANQTLEPDKKKRNRRNRPIKERDFMTQSEGGNTSNNYHSLKNQDNIEEEVLPGTVEPNLQHSKELEDRADMPLPRQRKARAETGQNKDKDKRGLSVQSGFKRVEKPANQARNKSVVRQKNETVEPVSRVQRLKSWQQDPGLQIEDAGDIAFGNSQLQDLQLVYQKKESGRFSGRQLQIIDMGEMQLADAELKRATGATFPDDRKFNYEEERKKLDKIAQEYKDSINVSLKDSVGAGSKNTAPGHPPDNRNIFLDQSLMSLEDDNWNAEQINPKRFDLPEFEDYQAGGRETFQPRTLDTRPGARSQKVEKVERRKESYDQKELAARRARALREQISRTRLQPTQQIYLQRLAVKPSRPRGKK